MSYTSFVASFTFIAAALTVAGCGKKRENESSPEASTSGTQPSKPERRSKDHTGPELGAPLKKDKSNPITTSAIGKENTFGDLVVKVSAVRVWQFQMSDFAIHEPALIVLLDIRNTNPNRIIDVPSQFGTVRATDDLGNTYRELTVLNTTGDGIWADRTEMVYQRTARLRVEKPTTDVVLFERPVLGAKKVTIDLDASKYGGEGTIRIEVPRTVWELPATKKQSGKH